jgi:hypothetical protein
LRLVPHQKMAIDYSSCRIRPTVKTTKVRLTGRAFISGKGEGVVKEIIKRVNGEMAQIQVKYVR